MFIENFKKEYNLFIAKKGDELLIKIGVVGVVIGLLLSMSFLNQLFAWFILVGAGIKICEYVINAEKRIEYKRDESKSLADNIKENYEQFIANKCDNTLIKIGVIGVLIGLVFALPFINQLFAWFILIGAGFKIFNFVANDGKTTATQKSDD